MELLLKSGFFLEKVRNALFRNYFMGRVFNPLRKTGLFWNAFLFHPNHIQGMEYRVENDKVPSSPCGVMSFHDLEPNNENNAMPPSLPACNIRVKGTIYEIEGLRKKWDGKRFALCCRKCLKLAQGRTDLCKMHGGGYRCQKEGCSRASRGKEILCAKHGGGERCEMKGCKKSAFCKKYCRRHGIMLNLIPGSKLKKKKSNAELPAYFQLL